MPTFCLACHAEVARTDRFCPSCGAPLESGRDARETAVLPAAPAPPRPAGPAPAPATAARSWFRKKRVMVPLVSLAIIVAVSLAAPLTLDRLTADLRQFATPDPGSPAGVALTTSRSELPAVAPTADGSVTVLLMGVDARPGEEIDIGVRPDSLEVLHINGQAGTCRVLSIPRDTRTLLPGYGQSKINHALAVGGVDYEQLVVEQFFGISMDHVGLIDMVGVQTMVDAVGGVDVTNQTAFELDGVSFPAGPQHLDGAQALLYSRFRYDQEGDWGRQRRQQEVAQAILGSASPRDLPSMLEGLRGHVRTDLTTTSLASLAWQYRAHCAGGAMATSSITGTVGNDYDELMGQELSFVHVDPAERDERVQWLLGN